MKLDELTRYYPFDTDVVDAAQKYIPIFDTYGLIEKLKTLGWEKAGNPSSYSDVFINPNKPYIIKANRVPDAGFAWFAFLTRKFPNPHFPKIGNMKVIKSKVGKEKFYVYLIEKLEEVSIRNTSEWKAFTRILNKYISGQYSLEEAEQYTIKLYGGEIDSEIVQQHLSSIKNNFTFLQALDILLKHQKNFSVDVHYENIMQRKDGTLVIIDPYTD